MEADTEVAGPTAADDSAPDDSADSADADDLALAVAVAAARRLVCFLRPVLPGWACRLGHLALAA